MGRVFQVSGDAPGQQFVNAVDRVIGDAGQHVAQVSARVDTIEFAAADERVHRGCPLAPLSEPAKRKFLRLRRIPRSRNNAQPQVMLSLHHAGRHGRRCDMHCREMRVAANCA
jgi:hypothetical protein